MMKFYEALSSVMKIEPVCITPLSSTGLFPYEVVEERVGSMQRALDMLTVAREFKIPSRVSDTDILRVVSGDDGICIEIPSKISAEGSVSEAHESVSRELTLWRAKARLYQADIDRSIESIISAYAGQ